MNPNEPMIEEVLAAERAWVRAHETLDLATLEEMMGDDYTIIQSDGRVVGKAETLASYGSGSREWEHAESDDYHVRVYGDTAVVIGRWTAKGINSGNAFDYAARFTAIYVKREGHWQIVADQSTTIKNT